MSLSNLQATKVKNESVAEDKLLVRRCQNGEHAAFNQLVLKYQDRVFNITLRMIGNWEEACDLTQEIFLKAFQGLSTFQGKASFFTWLFRITINVTISRRRKYISQKKHLTFSLDGRDRDNHQDGTHEPVDPAPLPCENMEWQESLQLVEKAIGELTDDFRAVVLLRDIEGFSYEEIAEMLECPIGTIRSRLHRARNMLRLKLQTLL